MLTIQESEIIANEITQNNDWFEISKTPNLTEEFMRTYKDKLYWTIVITYSKVPEEILSELIESNKFSSRDLGHRLHKFQDLSDSFIIKYKGMLNLPQICKQKKYSISYIVEHFLIKSKVGDGATISYGSDCYPYTIIEINEKGNKMKIQSDNYKRIDKNGYPSTEQEYSYSPNLQGVIYEISLRKDMRWKIVHSDQIVRVGYRKHYSDPHF